MSAEPSGNGLTQVLSAINKLASFFEDDDQNVENSPATVDARCDSPPRKKRRSSRTERPTRAMLSRANNQLADGKTDDALEICQKILARTGACSEVRLLMAECYGEKNDFLAALKAVRRVVEYQPSHLEAWTQYLKYAVSSKLMDEEVTAIKALVQLNSVPEPDKFEHLGHLIQLLMDEKCDLRELLEYQKQLLEIADKIPDQSETAFRAAISLASGYICLGKPDQSLVFLADRLDFPLARRNDGPPRRILVLAVGVYAVAMLGAGKHEECLAYLFANGILESQPREPPIKFQDAYVNGRDAHSNGLVAAVCLCLLKRDISDFLSVKTIIEDILLTGESFALSELYLKLSRFLLFEAGDATVARRLMIHVDKFIPDFRGIDAYNLLGNIYENMKDAVQARAAYSASMDIRSNRMARDRLHYLDGDCPSFMPFGVTAGQKNELMRRQTVLYEAYLQSDSAALVDRAKEFILATFQFTLPPKVETFLWTLNTPFAVDNATKKKRVSCLLVATRKVSLGSWFDVAYTGCTQAFALQRYQDMVDIAFHGLLTLEVYSDQEKVDILKMAIAVAAFYLPRESTADSHWTTRRIFFFDYIRELLNRSKIVTLPVVLWNAFYALIMDTTVMPEIKVGKWGNFFRKKKDFCLQVTVILAHDALRRKGGCLHAYNLYLEIVNNIGSGEIPWQIWMHLGILAVNVACRYGLTRTNRRSYYTTGMAYLEKYGQLRGTCPEVLYNKARAAHVFGDHSVAIRFYSQCLELCRRTTVLNPTTPGSAWLVEDIQFRAAFNLRGLYAFKSEFEQARCLYGDGTLSWKNLRPKKD